MPAYDQNCSPPAPIAFVNWRNAGTSETVADVPMLLDTGADLTLVPQSVADQLGVLPLPGQQYELAGFDGVHSWASAVILDLIWVGKAFRGRYLLTEDALGIIGRDVLNHLNVEFNGPSLEWNVRN